VLSAVGDRGYLGLGTRHPLGATPRRKPRGRDRPPEDSAYNRAFARRRIAVEHTIGQVRSFQSLAQTDRHHRCNHSARARAVAGLVNRRLRRVCAYRERLAA
jgi:SRSO17 transposase